ncbi:MAG: hypothetical protein SH848_00135 [Saprospiraceae bacterium]|nr:hypothetical protein [Saprospiraceae bacterium]
MKARPLVSFDWAIKKLLRQKANYDVLEGLLTVLLRRHIKIVNIPESEGNSEQADDKINKVDILCENEHPEYYIIKVNKFNDIAKDTLDEWIYYLKNNSLPEHYSAPGLDKVAELLNYDNMDASAKAQYEAHQKELAISYGVLETAKAEGRVEGQEEKTIAVVVNSFRLGLDIPTIGVVAAIREEEVVRILKEQGMMN